MIESHKEGHSMNKHARIAHAVAAIGLTIHVAGHLVAEAWHEAILEVAISPIMHLVEHHVGRAEAAAGMIAEAAPIAEAPKAPCFKAHHRDGGC